MRTLQTSFITQRCVFPQQCGESSRNTENKSRYMYITGLKQTCIFHHFPRAHFANLDIDAWLLDARRMWAFQRMTWRNLLKRFGAPNWMEFWNFGILDGTSKESPHGRNINSCESYQLYSAIICTLGFNIQSFAKIGFLTQKSLPNPVDTCRKLLQEIPWTLTWRR